MRVIDSTVFEASAPIAAARLETVPGAMRELHWHPRSPEGRHDLSGRARMSVFAAGDTFRTLDVQAGDVGDVPQTMGHHVENTGSEPVRYLGMFVGPRYAEVSLDRWLALIPPALVKAHLDLDDGLPARPRKRKGLVA